MYVVVDARGPVRRATDVQRKRDIQERGHPDIIVFFDLGFLNRP